MGEIEGKSMMASSSWCFYTHTHLSCLFNSLRHHQNNNSSVNKTVVQASNLSEKLSKAAVTAATTAALFASVRFFFLCSFGLVLRRVVLNGDKKTLRAFEEEEEERFSQIVSLSLFFVVISRARLKSLSRHSSSSSFWETTEEEKTLRWWWERFERDPRRENEEGKSFKNRISSRFALISKFIFGPKRSQKTWGKEEQGEFFFSREFLVEPTTTTPTKEMSFEKRELTFPSLFLPFNFFLLKTW